MAKEKKITVKFYPVKGRHEGVFSVYCLVTYNRVNTRFVTRFEIFKDSLEDAKEEVLSLQKIGSKNDHSLGGLKNWIEEIVKLEIKLFGDNYSIIGIKDRMELYMSDMIFYFPRILKEETFRKLEDKITYRSYKEAEALMPSQIEGMYYFHLINLLKYLGEDKKLSLPKVISNELKKKIISVGYFLAYIINGAEQQPGIKFNELDFFYGGQNLGHWLVGKTKERFRKYLTENNANNQLKEYFTRIGISSPNLFDFELDSNEVIIIIDKMAQEVFKE